MKIAVIIPYYKGAGFLRSLLESIDLSVYDAELTVIVIDNCPLGIDPGLKRATFSFSLRVIRSSSGIGYGKACNIGFDFAMMNSFDYLMVINQDGHVSPDLISRLLNFLENSDYLVAVPFELNYESGKVDPFFIRHYLSQCPLFVLDSLKNANRDHYDILNFSGACFMLKLKVYPYIYLFDEVFHMYYEDEDLSRRIKMINKKVALVTKATFFHHHMHINDFKNKSLILKWKTCSEYIFYLKGSDLFFIDFIKYSYHMFLFLIIALLKLKFRYSYYILYGLLRMIYFSPVIFRNRQYELKESLRFKSICAAKK